VNGLNVAGEVVGASTALAGLILVYLGSIAASYASYETTQQGSVRLSHQRRIWLAFIGFVFALGSSALADWLRMQRHNCGNPAVYRVHLGDRFRPDDRFGGALMSLTREMEQRLDRAGLIGHFNTNQAAWQANCQDAYDYTNCGKFSTVRSSLRNIGSTSSPRW
jgi:hypothetical protein